MIFPYDKKFETQTTIKANPKRLYRLVSTFGDEGIAQRREGDLVPFLERSGREKLVDTRVAEETWAETRAEETRLKYLYKKKEQNLLEWLNEVQVMSPNLAYRNRLFPRQWRSDRIVSRLFQAEQSIMNNHKNLGQDWDIVDWNCLSFWCFPKMNYSSNFILEAIEATRSRAVMWRNAIGTDSIYASSNGSVTIDFWIAPRLSVENGEAGCILHVPGIISVFLYPEPISNVSSEDINLNERFRIVVVKESELGNSVDAIQDFCDLETIEPGNKWVSEGFLATPPLINRGEWSHVSIVYDNSGNQFSFIINQEVVFEIAFSTSQNFWFTNESQPEALCFGGRLKQGGDMASEFDFTPNPENEYGDPLCADLHTVRIWGRALSREEIQKGIGGVEIRNNLLFEADFYFNPNSPSRPHLNRALVPASSSEKFPINSEIAWNYGIPILNLDGYLYDSSTGNFGIGVGFMSELFGVPSGDYEDIAEVIRYLYLIRNSSILPNDNKLSRPNKFGLKIPFEQRKQVSTLLDKQMGEIPNAILRVDEFIEEGYEFVSPEQDISPILLESIDFPVLQQLRTPRTRSTTFFEIQNLFFGSRILEGSLRLEYNLGAELVYALYQRVEGGDPATGTTQEELVDFMHKIANDKSCRRGIITFSDDTDGRIIRSEVQFPEATGEYEKGKMGQSLKCGSLDRFQGLGAIHYPAIWGAGNYFWKVELSGERNIIVNEYIIPVPEGELKSSNPNWRTLYSTEKDLPNKSESPRIGDNNTIGFTNIFLYDRNLNVVVKSKTAQPIYRVPSDKIAFKVKLDF